MTRDYKAIEDGVYLILKGLGVDEFDHNFKDTPKRVAKVYREMFDPPPTKMPVFEENYTDMVIFRNHIFYTMCPHHLLPVKLTTTVAYIPNGKVIGASKLGRIQHEVNRYPMTQERLTFDILERLNTITGGTAQGAAILMRGEHGCFSIRGLHSSGDMVTIKYAGCFEEDAKLQSRFMTLATLR